MSRNETVDANGLTFRVRIDRAGETAPWLLFSNSLVTDLSFWDGQVAAFGPRFNILRYDQRGHGGTGVPASAPDFEALGDDVAAIMAATGVPRCTYVGLSMGVPTGLHLVAARPDLVERLVLCDGGPRTPPGRDQFWADKIAAARRDGMAPFVDDTMARWFSPAFIASSEAEAVRAVMRRTPLEGFAACATALRSYDCSAVLPRIDVPVLLVAGARDGDVPNAMRRLVDLIRGAAFVEIPDAGHIPNVEQPEAFNAVLGRFLGA